MVKTKFRPSDDSSEFGFLIPANAMAVVELSQVSQMLTSIGPTFNSSLAIRAEKLIKDISAGIEKNGKINGIFAYEVDGFGSFSLMDDANSPSLLALPYLGYLNKTEETYLKTRALLWSKMNPYFYSGSVASGISSPHTPHVRQLLQKKTFLRNLADLKKNYIWPMSIITHAITSNDDNEIVQDLEMLKRSTAGTNFVHESFNKNNASIFTRSWFAWANTYFGELIYTLGQERPHLVFKN